MSSSSILVASISDISDIVKIRLRTISVKEISGFSASEFAITSSNEKLRKAWNRDNMLKDGFEIFLAENDGNLVGYMLFKVEGYSAYIDDVVVGKEEQRKGVGTALVSSAEDITKSLGFSLIKTVTTENVNGIPWESYNFWLKMNYEDTGKRIPTDYDFKIIPFIKKIKVVWN